MRVVGFFAERLCKSLVQQTPSWFESVKSLLPVGLRLSLVPLLCLGVASPSAVANSELPSMRLSVSQTPKSLVERLRFVTVLRLCTINRVHTASSWSLSTGQ